MKARNEKVIREEFTANDEQTTRQEKVLNAQNMGEMHVCMFNRNKTQKKVGSFKVTAH